MVVTPSENLRTKREAKEGRGDSEKGKEKGEGGCKEGGEREEEDRQERETQQMEFQGECQREERGDRNVKGKISSTKEKRSRRQEEELN